MSLAEGVKDASYIHFYVLNWDIKKGSFLTRYFFSAPGLFKNNVNGKEKLVELINDAYR